MIDPLAIHRADARIADQAAFHSLALDPDMHLTGGIQGFLAGPDGDQFNSPEQTAAPDIANVGMIAKPLMKLVDKDVAQLAHIGQQIQ